MKLSLVIPVYMNEGSLKNTYLRLKSVINTLKKVDYYEMIFINDGSKDKSLQELYLLRDADPNVKIIDFIRNFGQVAAIQAGFKFATGDAVINISADMQDPPELIESMVEKWHEGFKIVVCARQEREDSLLSVITSKIFYYFIKYSLPTMPKGGFDCFLLDKDIYTVIGDSQIHNNFIQGDILWFGYEPYYISYKRQRREVGTSQWSISKKIKYFIDGLISTSYLPIRFMSFLGILIALFGFVYSIIIIGTWFVHKTPFSGYAPLMITLIFIGAMIMIMLGIIGEYLWRIYDELRNKPKYIIKRKFL